jgi:ATP-dependent RNA helicase DDX3X
LEAYVPEGEAKEHLKFEADSDFEEEEEDADGEDGGGWGPAPGGENKVDDDDAADTKAADKDSGW